MVCVLFILLLTFVAGTSSNTETLVLLDSSLRSALDFDVEPYVFVTINHILWYQVQQVVYYHHLLFIQLLMHIH